MAKSNELPKPSEASKDGKWCKQRKLIVEWKCSRKHTSLETACGNIRQEAFLGGAVKHHNLAIGEVLGRVY